MYQGKRSLLGKPCTFSSCIQLLIACSPSSSSGHCYYRNVAAIIVSLYLSSLTKAVPRAALPTAPPTCSCAHKGFSAWGSWWTALCICPWQLTDLPGNWGSHSLGCIPACTPAHSHDRACTVLGLEGVFVTAATGSGQGKFILHLWMSFAFGIKMWCYCSCCFLPCCVFMGT